MKRSKYVVFALLAGVLLYAGAKPACAETTWYVDDDVPADFSTIQGALDASSDGDTIIVRDGIYTGTGNRDISFGGKAVHLRSENGPETCIIDCEGAGGAFAFYSGEGGASVLNGFTITNGSASSGGGIYCSSSSPTITNNTITANTARFGGAILCNGSSSPMIANNTITGNTGDIGGGIACFQHASPTITNNTITGNAGCGIFCSRSWARVTNSILWGNSAPTAPEIYLAHASDSPSLLIVRYSNVEGGAGAAYVEEGSTLSLDCTNIDVDPLFADPGHWDDDGTPNDISDDMWINGDYHLRSTYGRWDPSASAGDGGWATDDVTSPCINAGDPTSDYSKEPQPNGDRINMGAYGNMSEASQGKWALPADTNNDSEVNVLDLLTVRDLISKDPASGDNWRGDVNEDGVINILDLIYVRNHLGAGCDSPGFHRYELTASFIYRDPNDPLTGGLVFPMTIACADDHLFINDIGIESWGLWEITMGGGFIQRYNPIMDLPWESKMTASASTMLRNTSLLVTNGHNVDVYTSQGNLLSSRNLGIGEMQGVAYAGVAARSYYVVSGDTVYRIDGIQAVDSFDLPVSVEAIGYGYIDGFIIGASGKTIYTIDLEGTLVSSQELDVSGEIRDLCFCSNGDLFVIDSGGGYVIIGQDQERILRFSPIK